MCPSGKPFRIKALVYPVLYSLVLQGCCSIIAVEKEVLDGVQKQNQARSLKEVVQENIHKIPPEE